MLSEVLAQARAHVAGGWREPLSLDAEGRICGATAEGISKFCVSDALCLAADFHGNLITQAEDALVQQVRGGRCAVDLWEWLEAPGRTLDEVQLLFGKAIARTRVMERR